MKVAVPREIAPGERRVALIPDMVAKLVKSGFEVIVQSGAGAGSSFSDEAYQSAGARIVPDASSAYGEADITLKVHRPSVDEVDLLREGSCLISLLQPSASLDIIPGLQSRRITAFSMDLVPRITRAQDMDVLSSMSTLAGYRAVLLGAVALGKLLPMIVSAAGTLTAARVLVLGAGVAGLQAIATARRLGAVVQAFDIPPGHQGAGPEPRRDLRRHGPERGADGGEVGLRQGAIPGLAGPGAADHCEAPPHRGPRHLHGPHPGEAGPPPHHLRTWSPR